MWAVIAIVAAVFASPVTSPTPETCAGVHALVGGDLVEWDSASYSWPSLPDDLERAGRVDFASGGIWARYSKSERARYLWVFIDYTIDGEPRGAHNFCGPYRIAD